MIVITNSIRLAFDEIQIVKKGEAEKAGLNIEEAVVKFFNEVRQELWEKRNVNND